MWLQMTSDDDDDNEDKDVLDEEEGPLSKVVNSMAWLPTNDGSKGDSSSIISICNVSFLYWH